MAYVITSDSVCRLALEQLHVAVVQDWLARQPAHRVIGQPRSVVGGCLATFLASTTDRMWCVARTQIWPLDLTAQDAAPLPDFAVAFVALEDQIAEEVITVAQARLLLDRVAPRLRITSRIA